MNTPEAADQALARAIVHDAARHYIDTRRARIDAFVDRHFTLRGSLVLHRRVLGWDLVRAPVNLFLTAPALAVKLLGRMARRFGWERPSLWLGRRRVLLETALSREIEWLVTTELLELPCAQKGRLATRDAFAEAILADPRAAQRLAAPLAALETAGADPQLRQRLLAAIESYTGTRAAITEITTGLVATGVGALVVKQATPGLVTLGSALAGMIAQQSAIAAFPLGAWLGSVWYGWYPVAPGPGLLALTIGGALAGGAVLAAFSGILTDPLQRRLGLHRRRLQRLVEALEAVLCDAGDEPLAMRDHYVARLLDLLDYAAMLWRVTHA
jgi:hypothetical protein